MMGLGGLVVLPIGGGLMGLGGIVAGAAAGAVIFPFMPIWGAIKAVPAEVARKIDDSLYHELTKANPQEALACSILDESKKMDGYHLYGVPKDTTVSNQGEQNYKAADFPEFDSVLEINVDSLGFKGGEGSNPEIALFMTTKARLIKLDDQKVLYEREFTYQSAGYHWDEWARNDSLLIAIKFIDAYHNLAEQILTETFLVYEFPENSWSYTDYCILKPVYPKLEISRCYLPYLFYFLHNPFCESGLNYVAVSSTKPTFQWQALADHQNLQGENASILKYFSDISYDLRIWEVTNDQPGSIVYERHRLVKPYHTIEVPLKSETEYFWSFRASFKVNGQRRVSRWASSRIPRGSNNTCEQSFITDSNYFRFATP
ncbi:MAG: hypothetical protein KGZ88_02690 [Methylomicrobium sp.]|nr:hypothetical protein [Methylomicrobium sp.]